MKELPLETATARAHPCDPPDLAQAFIEFARDALARIAPRLATTALVLDESAGELYGSSRHRRRWGTAAAGFELDEQREFIERVGWQGERLWVSLTTYGLPGGASLRLSHGERTASCSVTAPAPLATRIAADFERRFDLPPSRADLDSLVSAARAALSRGRWEEAQADGHAVLKHRPRDPDALLCVGVAAGATGDAVMAQLALEELMAVDPTHVDGRYNLGNLFFERQDWPAALAHFKAALATDPANHPAHYQLARTLEHLDRPTEALAAYRRAVETSPNPGGTWGYSGMDFTEKAQEAIRRLEA